MENLFGILGRAAFRNRVRVVIEPLGLELHKAVATLLVRICDGLLGGQCDHRVGQSDRTVTARLIGLVLGADAPRPMLDLLAIATTDRAGTFDGLRRTCVSTFSSIQNGATTFKFLDAGLVGQVLGRPDHDLFFAIDHQRRFGSHHDFAVTTKTISVDGRIGNDDFLVRILVVRWNAARAGVAVNLILVAHIKIVVVTLPRKFVATINVIVCITILWEDMTSAQCVDRQRMNVLPFFLGQ